MATQQTQQIEMTRQANLGVPSEVIVELMQSAPHICKRVQAIQHSGQKLFGEYVKLKQIDGNFLVMGTITDTNRDYATKQEVPCEAWVVALLRPISDSSDMEVMLLRKSNKTIQALEQGNVYQPFNTGEEFKGWPVWGVLEHNPRAQQVAQAAEAAPVSQDSYDDIPF